MNRKQWDSKTKWMVVLEGLKGRSVSEICTEYGLCQSQYYKWRDQFLSNAPKLFDVPKEDRQHLCLGKENARLKRIIGELTVELKKNDELFD